jgi:hypothetical protein
MAKTRKTPRPQKSSAKAKAAVNKIKGAATTAPRSPDESDEPDEPDKAEVEVDTETVVSDHPKAEQKIKEDEIYVDDGATGIQCVMEESAAVVSVSGVATTKTALAVVPKKPKVKKPSPSKGKNPASKDKKPAPQVMIRYFGYVFSELCRYKADHGTMSVPKSKDGTKNVLANWIHYIRKRYKNNVLPATHTSILNGINFEWTVGQITKKGFKGWFTELVEYQKQNDTIEVFGGNHTKKCGLPSGETMQR